MKPKPAPAKMVDVKNFKVWYHLPFQLKSIPDFTEKGWVDVASIPSRSRPSFKQHNYFHHFVSKTLWGANKTFRMLEKPCAADIEFSAKRVFKVGSVEEISCFDAQLERAELRIVPYDPESVSHSNPALAILIVEVTFKAAHEGEPTETHLTLADVQNALEWVRRIFPRWWQGGAPGDALASVTTKTKGGTANKTYLAPNEQEMEDAFAQSWPSVQQATQPHGDFAHSTQAHTPIMPWLVDLLDPFCTNGNMLEHFGDDRSFMTSAICLKAEASSAQTIMAKVGEDDLFRLAEADKAHLFGSSYPYQKPFLEKLRDGYFYDRHAYDGDTETGNNTQYLMSHHHLCCLGAGSYFLDEVFPDVGDYYRHMQFLCIFEYYRLLQFSFRLTQLVECKDEDNLEPFRKGLYEIRDDFLEYTHMHHFSNVSSQLQPREMFAKLRVAMGLEGMFEEVAAELEAASNFVAMMESKEQAEAAETLNNLVALGVPLSLVTGVAGMNLVVADHHDVLVDIQTLCLVGFAVFFIWGIAEMFFLRDKRPLVAQSWVRRFLNMHIILAFVFAGIFAAILPF